MKFKFLQQFSKVAAVGLVLTAMPALSQTEGAKSEAKASPTRPNIVFILADDVGVGDISFYRKQYMKDPPVLETPA
ncbi:MAG: hypothetical protein AAF571_13985, partial [Verrucomicrobiota bacterium]